MIASHNTKICKTCVFASLIMIIVMHLSGNEVNKLFFAVFSAFIVMLPTEYSIIIVFSFSFHGEGFKVNEILMIAYLAIILSLKLVIDALINHKKYSITVILCSMVLFALSIGHLPDIRVVDFVRLGARFMLVAFLLGNGEIVFGEDEGRTLADAAFCSALVFAFFSLSAGFHAYGQATYMNMLLGEFRLGEEYRDFGGADAIGYMLCLIYPLQLKLMADGSRSSVNCIVRLILLFAIGILSKTRSFLLTGSVLTVAFVLYKIKVDKKNRWKTILTTALAAIVLIDVCKSNLYISQAFGRFSEGDVSNGRFDIYRNLMDIFDKHIFVGVGFEYKELAGILAHNIFLEILVAWGIIGMAAMIVLSVKSYIVRNVSFRKNSAIFYWLGFFIACCTISSITYDKFYINYCMLFLLAARKEATDEKTNNRVYTDI